MECLPRELVSNVFSRLPTKDLMRCKCVCKSWFDLISDPHFISYYYVFYNSQEVQQQEQHFMLIRTIIYHSTNFSDTEISIRSWNSNEPKGLVSFQLLNLPPYQDGYGMDIMGPCNGYGMDIMGPCNGIYFVKGKPNIIMNPSLRQFIALPQPHFIHSPHDEDYSSGDYSRFGFDPKTNDYKVVMIADEWIDSKMAGWTIELYSLNSNSWRILDANAIPFPFENLDTSSFFTYVNNCCHWFGCIYQSDENVVLSFDMVSELFKKIKVPKMTDSLGPTVTSIKEVIPFSESSTIGVIHYYKVVQGTEICFGFGVWVMRDYWDEGSWIKRYNVGLMPVIYNSLRGFYGNDQSLWVDPNDILVFYGIDSEKHTRDVMACGNRDSTKGVWGVVRYMESLVSLQRGMRF